MQINMFAKALSSIMAGGGTTYGVVEMYEYIRPKTWGEYLKKRGKHQIITQEYDDRYWEAIFHDQREKIKTYEDLKNTSSHSSIKTWCLNTGLKGSSKNYANKDKVERLCTANGIETVEGIFISNGIKEKGKKQNKFIKNEEKSKQDDLYKEVFSVNRFMSSDFLSWIQEETKGNKEFAILTHVSTGYKALKITCEKILKGKFDGNIQRIQYVDWWCRNPKEGTIKERIKSRYSKRERSNWNGFLEMWYKNELVTREIKTSIGKKDYEHLEQNDFAKYCSENINKKLNEESYYIQKYVVVKSICFQK